MRRGMMTRFTSSRDILDMLKFANAVCIVRASSIKMAKVTFDLPESLRPYLPQEPQVDYLLEDID